MKVATCGIVTVLAYSSISTALAKPEYRSRIPNGFNVPNVQAVGHTDPQGDSASLNSFGKAFNGVGKKWTIVLCQADSDGDGQTNGQELGDPCCEWTASGTPRRTDGLSDPGKASSTSNASLWANLNCSTATTISAAPHARASTWTTSLALLSGAVVAAMAVARD